MYIDDPTAGKLQIQLDKRIQIMPSGPGFSLSSLLSAFVSDFTLRMKFPSVWELKVCIFTP